MEDKFNINEYVKPDPRADGALVLSAPLGFRGEMKMWPVATPPAGWLVCDGSLVTIAKYPELYSIIGTTYNTGGETAGVDFRIPDLREKVPIGYKSGSAESGTLGQQYGAKTVTLSTNEMPNHTHYPGAPGARVHTPDVNNGTAAGGGPAVWGAYVNGATGGGAAHQNMQPGLAINFIIKF